MSSDPPPPYPGTQGAFSEGGAFPPVNSAYPPPPVDPYKGMQGYNQPGTYNQPGMPGGGYSQSGYQAQPAYPTSTGTTVVVTQPTIRMVQMFRESPVHTCCPHCRAEVMTGTHYETGSMTWVICCVLWWIGCGLGCCLIPFCMDACKDVIHTCPNCHQQIARYSRM